MDAVVVVVVGAAAAEAGAACEIVRDEAVEAFPPEDPVQTGGSSWNHVSVGESLSVYDRRDWSSDVNGVWWFESTFSFAGNCSCHIVTGYARTLTSG